MKLLTKPKEYDLNKIYEYETFNFFKLALTERNWIGPNYIQKNECTWFIEELKEFNSEFNTLFEEIENSTELYFLIDISLFSGELPSNLNLLEFLEELEDFHVIEDSNNEKIKLSVKYKKKFRNYANNIENIPYLYRWVFSMPEHSFSNEMKIYLDNTIDTLGIRDMNKFTKNIENEFRKFLKKRQASTFEELLDEEEFTLLKDKSFSLYHEHQAKFIQSVLKNCFEEPTLFFYGIYSTHRYLKNVFDFARVTKGLMSDKYNLPTFITLERPVRNLEAFVDKPTIKVINMYLQHQPFIHSLPKQKDDIFYGSLYDVKNDNYDFEYEKINVLKTIIKWASNRIPEKALETEIFKKKWLHIIQDSFFDEMDIKAMKFNHCDVVKGPNENELLVQAVAMTDASKPILFPLFDTDSWVELNSRQCAIIAYGICLFHDLCNPSNYHLIPLNELFDTKDRNADGIIDYGLFINRKEKQKNISVPKTNNIFSRDRTKESEQTENWVSFYFRKLKNGQRTSAEAKKKAAKYGFNEIPKGFTFVDSFTKGDKIEDTNEIKISAIEVLLKTLEKIENPKELSVGK